MSLTHQMDVYCERVDFSFWAEPFNATTNVAFIIAAFFVWRFARQMNVTDQRSVQSLTILLILIGIGSFAFHTFATRWAALADMIPIITAIATFFYVTLTRIFDVRPLYAAIGILYFPIAGYISYAPLFDVLGSSKSYIPALFMLIAFAIYAVRRNLHSAHYIIMAFLVFSLSLLSRTLDDHICTLWPYGTHFMWHILNAITLYLCLRFYIQAQMEDDSA